MEVPQGSERFFSGYHASVQEFVAKMKSSTTSKRANVALEYFGRMTTLELPLHALDRI